MEAYRKNIGPAGVVIVIIREDLITEDVLPGTPTMLKIQKRMQMRILSTTLRLHTESIFAEKCLSG